MQKNVIGEIRWLSNIPLAVIISTGLLGVLQKGILIAYCQGCERHSNKSYLGFKKGYLYRSVSNDSNCREKYSKFNNFNSFIDRFTESNTELSYRTIHICRIQIKICLCLKRKLFKQNISNLGYEKYSRVSDLHLSLYDRENIQNMTFSTVSPTY